MKSKMRRENIKRLRKQIENINGILQIITICFCIVSLNILIFNIDKNNGINSIYLVVSIVIYLIIIMCIIGIRQIVLKKLFKMQEAMIANITKEEDLKKRFNFKNEEVIQKILLTQVKQITFKGYKEKELKAAVLFGHNHLLYPICFPKDKLLSCMYEEDKDRILRYGVKDIYIERLKEEKIRINIELIDGDIIFIECCNDQIGEYFE